MLTNGGRGRTSCCWTGAGVPRGQQLRHVFDFCRTLSGLGRSHGQGDQNTQSEYHFECFHGIFLRLNCGKRASREFRRLNINR